MLETLIATISFWWETLWIYALCSNLLVIIICVSTISIHRSLSSLLLTFFSLHHVGALVAVNQLISNYAYRGILIDGCLLHLNRSDLICSGYIDYFESDIHTFQSKGSHNMSQSAAPFLKKLLKLDASRSIWFRPRIWSSVTRGLLRPSLIHWSNGRTTSLMWNINPSRITSCKFENWISWELVKFLKSKCPVQSEHH